MKYIVMECHPAYAVLLDSEGRFVKACNLKYETGQTVFDPILIKDEDNMMDNIRRIDRKRRITKYTLVAACIVVFLCINVFRFFIADHTSLYVRINPEVRIDMNMLGQVTAVEGENADGKLLLTDYSLNDRDKVTVCREIINKAIESGYLIKGEKVCVYIDSDDENFRKIGNELRLGLAQFSEDKFALDVEILDISQYVFGSAEDESSETEASSAKIYEEETSSSVVGEHHSSDEHNGHNGNDIPDDDDYDDDDDDDDDDYDGDDDYDDDHDDNDGY